MIHKVTNRSRLRSSDWLRQVKTLEWKAVQKPNPTGLGVQAADFGKPLDGDSAARRIRDLFYEVQSRGCDPVESDGEMAPGIHAILEGISYREAADPDFWSYLVAFGCPEYPRWRWPQSDADHEKRYAGGIRRNAFAALWWWAEISHDPSKPLSDPDRYLETRIVKGRTSFVLYCIDCAFSGHRQLMRSLCGLQRRHKLGDNASQKLCRSVNRMARTVCLDHLTELPEVEAFGSRAHELASLLR